MDPGFTERDGCSGVTLTDEAGAMVTPGTFIGGLWRFAGRMLTPSPTADCRVAADAHRLHSRRAGPGAEAQNLVTDRAGERNSDPRDTMEL